MKRPTVFLGEMTNPEVEAFVAGHKTVIVPIGSTEQHGPHGPLSTDTIVPTEVARRVAPKVGAAVAPSIGYGLSYPHAGFAGVVYLRIPTFMALVEDCRRRPGDDGLPHDRVPQRSLRQHACHRVCLCEWRPTACPPVCAPSRSTTGTG